MTILPSTHNPFVELDDLRNKLEARIRKRAEILDIVNQGNVTAGIQRAESEGIKLLDGPELSLRILQEQMKALDLVKDKQAQIEKAQTALANINIEEMETAVDQALGIDYLQQADAALFELDIPKLNSLITKFDGLNLPDTTLLDWKNELQADERWLLKNTTSGYSVIYSERTLSDWEKLQSCTKRLIQERKKLDDDQWQFLEQLSQRRPKSRLLAKYKWLDVTYRHETPTNTKQDDDLQTSITNLVYMFRDKATIKEMEQQLQSISGKIKNIALSQSTSNAANPLVNIFLLPFLNIWIELIHDSRQIQQDLEQLKDLMNSIASEHDLMSFIKRLGQIIENSNDVAFYPHTETCTDILDKLRKQNAPFPNSKRSNYIQGLLEKAKDKQTRGKERLEQIWPSANWMV